MSELQDIRAWAKANGIEIASRGNVKNSVREQYRASRNGTADEDAGELPEENITEADLMPPGEPESPAEAPAPPVEGKVAERPPKPQRRTRQRRSLFQRDKAKTPSKRKAKTAPKRVSVAGLISGAWMFGAYAAGRTERGIPLARCLEMQSQVAGPVVEDMIKDTVVDKVLQPLARMGENGRKGAALIGLPVAVGICTANPQIYPVAKPVMRLLLMDWFELAGPAMEKAQERARKLDESLAGLDLDAMLDSFWAGLPVPTQESPDEEEAIRRARGE